MLSCVLGIRFASYVRQIDTMTRSLHVTLEEKVDSKDLTIRPDIGQTVTWRQTIGLEQPWQVVLSFNLHRWAELPPDADLVVFARVEHREEAKTAQLTINRAYRRISFSVDDDLVVEFSISGEVESGLTLSATANGQDLNGEERSLMLKLKREDEGKYEGSALLKRAEEALVTIEAELEKSGQRELKLTLEANAEDEWSGEFQLEMKNGEDEKSAEAKIVVNGEDKAEVKIDFESGRGLKLEVKTPFEKLKSLDFKVERVENGGTQSSLKFNEGEENAFASRLISEQSEDVFKLDILTTTRGHSLTAKIDLNLEEKNLEAECGFNDLVISLRAGADGDDAASLTFASPFDGLRQVELTGSWSTSSTGSIIEATGTADRVPLTFRAEATRADDRGNRYFNWEMSRGTQRVALKAERRGNAHLKEIWVTADVLNDHSEFKFFHDVQATYEKNHDDLCGLVHHAYAL